MTKTIVYLVCLIFSGQIFGYSNQITTQGQKIIDNAGRQVILHGVNQVNKRPPYYSGPESDGFNEEHAKFLHKHGINAVRLGIYWAVIQPDAPSGGVPQYNINYLNQVKETVKLLHRFNIYTLLDFHQDAYSQTHGGLGAPKWAALSPGDWSDAENVGFPENLFGGVTIFGRYVSKTIDEDFDHFWQNTNNIQTAYLDMLEFVVDYFKETPGVMGYDIMNEPVIGTQWVNCGVINDDGSFSFEQGCEAFDVGTIKPFYEQAISRIHQADPNKIAWYEPTGEFGLGAPSHIPVTGKNVGFSFHNYYSPDLLLGFKNASMQSQQENIPLLMTEFGASTLNEEQLSTVLSQADTLNLSWMIWAYSNNPTYKFSIWPAGLPKDPSNQGLVRDLKAFIAQDCSKKSNCSAVNWHDLNLIDRPYPQFIAGDNLTYDYNPKTKTITVRYTYNQNIHLQHTQIYLPQAFHQNGYSLELQGVRQISANTDTSLVFKNTGEQDILIRIQLKV